MKRHRSVSRSSSKYRAARIQVDRLEERQLLSTAPAVGSTTTLNSYQANYVAHPMYEPLGSGGLSPDFSGAYTPAEISQAYGFNQIYFPGTSANGAGETIAIVDAYDDPNIQSDLNTFDTMYNLPATTVTRYNQTGGTSVPGVDPTGGWEGEESLDVEWAHAMAPGAKIDLFEASSADNDLFTAVTAASKVANVVSCSWGGGEGNGENSFDSYFDTPGVVYTISSGDSGAPASYPATSPNAIAVGGTALTTTATYNYSSESGWTGSSGGPSAYESQPTYQNGVVTQTKTARANPDVAYNGDPNTGFFIYDTFDSGGLEVVGGTSCGAPQWAALMAIAQQGRTLTGQKPLDNSGPEQVQTTLYADATNGSFHDVTTGASEGSPSYPCGPGYDYVTGIGSPITYSVVQDLDGIGNPKPNLNLKIGVPIMASAGTSFNVTVTVDNLNGTLDTGYTGTMALTSSDPQAVLPANYTFKASDRGSHVFAVTLKTAGSETVTATDAANPGDTVTSSPITVSAGPVAELGLSGFAPTEIAGTPVPFTVTAEDAYGNAVTNFSDPVVFTSSDTKAILPPTTDLSNGVGTFDITFETAGTESVTATDTLHTKVTGTFTGITVDPAAPTTLVATATSASQINLSWTAGAGDTAYIVERSLSASGGFTKIGTTSATTYPDSSGLLSGTTYYYEVEGTGGGFTSAVSNIASATTASGGVTGTGPTTPVDTGVNSIWSSSYTPTENASSSGSYDLGVQFESSVAGTVTGLRFYQAASMEGFSHVGYVWTTTQTLLATATFATTLTPGWQQVNLSEPVTITAGTVYIASFSTGGGNFGVSTGFFNTGGVTNGPLTAFANSAIAGGNGVFGNGLRAFPSSSVNGDNYWADLAFSPAGGSPGSTSNPITNPAIVLGGGSGSSNITVPPDLSGQTPGSTASSPRPSVITSPFQGRQTLLSGVWIGRRPSQLVPQGAPASLDD